MGKSRAALLSVLMMIALTILFSLLFAGRPSQVTGTQLDVDLNGNVYVLDHAKNTLKLFSKDDAQLAEVGGSGWLDTQFDQPAGVWARNGIDVFVADYGNHRIQRFDRKLSFISSFSTRDRENPDERFGYPTDVTVSRMGDLFIVDSENSRILKLNGLSKVERSFGGLGAGRGRLQKPTRVEIGPNDNVYVVDGRRVVVFDGFGNYMRDLIDEAFAGDILLAGDELGVVVLCGDSMYVFDEENKLRASLPLADLLNGERKDIRALTLSRGTLYLLGSDGLVTVPDPRH